MNVNFMSRCTRIMVSTVVVGAILATSSMFTLAQVPLTGELLVSGNNVTVNGEPGTNGRTFALPSSFTTGPGSYATLNFGKIGKLQLGPGTTFTIDGSGEILRGSLSAGSVTDVSSTNP